MNPPRDARRPVLALVLLVLGVAAAWLLPLDERAAESLDAGTKRAFATFAVARGLNAAISVMQGTEITGGVGVSATFSVGEVLDPVNDVVEQFADLMLFATVAFGIQEVLLSMAGHGAVQAFLVVLIAAWGAWSLAGRPPRWLDGVLVLALVVRFAIPAAVVGSDAVFRYFLEEDYRASEMAVRQEAEPAATAPVPGPEGGDGEAAGWLDALRQVWSDARKGVGELDVRDKLSELRGRAEATVEDIVRLIVVFLLQTLVAPLAILWAIYAVIRNVLAGGRARAGRAGENGPG